MIKQLLFEPGGGAEEAAAEEEAAEEEAAAAVEEEEAPHQAAAVALRAAIDFAQPHAQRAPLVREAIAVASARLAIEEEAGRREAEARLTLTLTPTLR